MISHRVAWAMIGLSVAVVCGPWQGQAAAQISIDVGGVHIRVGDDPLPPMPLPVEVEVLTRGPIHEAFAQPVVFDEGAGYLITQRPPPPLDEMLPDEKPEGNAIVWIPGYWGWDHDRSGFIWVSGCWRAVPPGTGWVPGYWAEVRGGYQWTSGFWATAEAEEVEYLPAPPATLEAGPPGVGSPDSIWIPGCWVRFQGRYAWRPGFWEQARPNWVWEPAHYVWSPRGYIYIEGHWDYPLDRRGVAFLPIYCPPRLYGRTDFRYSPAIVLDLGVLTVNLFSSPRRHHYYFGDYYGPEYYREGFHPWYEARERHDWYDPIFVHQRWQHRDDRRWVDNHRSEYERRRDNHDLRPARTYDAMRAQAARLPERDRRQAQTARPMREVVSDKATPFKFGAVDARSREDAARRARDSRDYQDKRTRWESRGPPAKEVEPRDRPPTPDRGPVVREPAGRDIEPERIRTPRPPITVREPVREKEMAPPPQPRLPNPDPAAQPRRGKDGSGRSRDDDGEDKDKHGSSRK